MEQNFDLGSLGDWNSTQIDEKFFTDNEEISVEEVIAEVKKEQGKDSKKDSEKSTEKTEDEIADGFFNFEDTEDENSNEDEPSKSKNSSSAESVSVSTVNFLIERGLLEYELEEGQELDEDTALEILEDNFDNKVDTKIQEMFSELPKELKALNKYVLNGGDMGEFISKLNTGGKISGITANLDINTEKNQELVLREMYKNEGMDQDFIDAQIETLKDSGRLANLAKKKFEKWKEEDIKYAEQEAREQEEFVKEQKQKQRQFFQGLKASVSEGIGGIKLSNKDKTEIPFYMTDVSVKVNGQTVTPFNRDLMQVLQNQEASIQLAKLLRDRKKDGTFDFTQVEKDITTKVAKEVKDNIRRNKEKPNRSTDNLRQSMSLVDLFDAD